MVGIRLRIVVAVIARRVGMFMSIGVIVDVEKEASMSIVSVRLQLLIYRA